MVVVGTKITLIITASSTAGSPIHQDARVPSVMTHQMSKNISIRRKTLGIRGVNMFTVVMRLINIASIYFSYLIGW